ncbi:ribonuclease E inhibitor RraB [Novosphingobium album (ex Hu et al. 2023)]|uniref:Ribonuclease E inhibitor RraB n=1 Tax=Novosphingobium album (ex Hu et al. 2023) TaxID=2930093 RepID=A0ABT0B1R3_9SPHN|nr:ribonuclease E inhibitor RraB [Novosphingobium album (ex Hu et al. 2023)]MCJ2178969.1 ribonuclease E inhibitor RraB [Novosphingobium album (ex Hu et al. 2023)]
MTPIDPERWNEVWAADLAVIQRLRDHGDLPHVIRDVDVSFRGTIEALRRLEFASSNWGFRVLEFVEADEDGQPWLFLVRSQTTDEEAIRELTMTYLQMEDSFEVECDGWGCEGQTRE